MAFPAARRNLWCGFLASAMCCAALVASAETLTGGALMDALRQGGYIIVMRHTSSPPNPPERAAADPRNTKLERELDETGRESARAMGEAMRSMHIQVGKVLSSPTFRALQGVRLAGFGEPEVATELGFERDATPGQAPQGQGMQGQGMRVPIDPASSDWLRKAAAEKPRAGTNTVIMTHVPNIVGAFGRDVGPIPDGGAVVFRPDGKGGVELVGRVKIEEWPQFAASAGKAQ